MKSVWNNRSFEQPSFVAAMPINSWMAGRKSLLYLNK